MNLKTAVLVSLAVSVVACDMAAESQAAPAWHMVNCNQTTQQSDCHLLEDGDVLAMIDVGTAEDALRSLVPYLRDGGINRIDHLFISHPHTDHYGGLEPLLTNKFSVRNLYYNMPPRGVSDFDFEPAHFQATLSQWQATGTKLHNVSKGLVVKLASSTLRVLEAKKDLQSGGVNDYSLIMRWEAGGYSTLFTGDLNANLGAQLVGNPIYAADFLKVPHHGVTGIAPNAFFDTVDPALVMIPAPSVLWTNPRGQQVREWSLARSASQQMLICSNGFNQSVRLSYHQTYVELSPQTPTQMCPTKTLAIVPKPLVNSGPQEFQPSVILMLLFDETTNEAQ